jgi:hypothetical protein
MTYRQLKRLHEDLSDFRDEYSIEGTEEYDIIQSVINNINNLMTE